MINPLDNETYTELSPEEFEKFVKEILEASSHGLCDFNAIHQNQVQGVDGSYNIDVTARFRALGADFLVLVECKHHKNPIKRDMVQVLKDHVQSIGAQKGMLFSTSGFQKGAIEYATTHGIALVRVVNGMTCYETHSLNGPLEPPDWANIPTFIGWLISVSCKNTYLMSIISEDMIDYLDNFLAQNDSKK